MKKERTIDWRRITGVYQIIGALIGFLFLELVIAGGEEQISPWILVTDFLFYLFSFVAGVLLLRKPAVGFKVSYVNQALQIFVIGAGPFRFFYLAGIGLVLKLDFTGKTLIILEALLSRFQFGLFESETYYFGLNFGAVVAMYLLAKSGRHKGTSGS
ncbi:MAG: hypothetical protein JST26_09565 [Bacteroidetes bacterium]|nr:hypothetical protein [Bacteroidota bacterium]